MIAKFIFANIRVAVTDNVSVDIDEPSSIEDRSVFSVLLVKLAGRVLVYYKGGILLLKGSRMKIKRLNVLPEKYKSYLTRNAQRHIENQLLAIDDGRLHLTRKGIFVSDDIMSDLIFV